MAKIRISIELDLDNPYVEGQRLERMSNAARALTRACESNDYPDVWLQGDGWIERDVTITTAREGRQVVGRFSVAPA